MEVEKEATEEEPTIKCEHNDIFSESLTASPNSFMDIPELIGIVKDENNEETICLGDSVCDKPAESNQDPLEAFCACPVFQMATHGEKVFTTQERRETIKTGRPTPPLSMKHLCRTFTRHFNQNNYIIYKWLTGCDVLNKLYCWPCLLFPPKQASVWTTTGFSDLNNIHFTMKRHASQKSHLRAVVLEKMIASEFEEEKRLQNQLNQKNNDLMIKNREVIKKIINIIIFKLGRDSKGVETIDLLNFLAKNDADLLNNLKEYPAFRDNASLIEGDLSTCLADIAQSETKKEINKAQFVSLIIYDSPKSSSLEQLIIAARYVKSSSGKPIATERFIRFLKMEPSMRMTDEMQSKILEIVKDLDCSNKCVSQSYGGGAVLPNHAGILQARLKQLLSSTSVHHCGIDLCEILAQATAVDNPKFKCFFLEIRGLIAMFSQSSSLRESLFFLNEVITWEFSGKLFQTLVTIKPFLIQTFQHVLTNKQLWDPEIVNSSRGYLQLFENDMEFNFLLNVFADILPLADSLLAALKSKLYEIDTCIQAINDTEKKISEKRKKFEHYWNLLSDLQNPSVSLSKRPRLDDDLMGTFKKLYIEMIEVILQRYRNSFKNLCDLRFMELCDFTSYSETAYICLKKSYGALVDTSHLRSQLQVLGEFTDINLDKSPEEMWRLLADYGLDDSFSEVKKFCELVMTIPAAAGYNENTNSIFDRMKDLKQIVENEKMFLLKMEGDSLRELAQNPEFYDDVIDRFSKINDKIELVYK